MPLRYGLEGAVVVLTGAAGGIGAALAAAFAQQGTTLVLVDRETASLERLAAALASTARSVHAMPCELGSDAEVARLAGRIGRECGGVNVLVNNAGTEFPTPLAGGGEEAMPRWAALLDNNVVSMARLTRALLPLLARGASVINQSSIWGHTGVADFSAYSASKHAVIGLTRSLAFELAPREIRVNAVCPGLDPHRGGDALAARDGRRARHRRCRDGSRDRRAPGAAGHAGAGRHHRRLPVPGEHRRGFAHRAVAGGEPR